MKRAVKALAVAATVGMFAVLVMGATVTNTGSEHGCGRSWPLCHGKLIPQFAVSTAIEFSHRAIVGVESVLILAFAAGALYVYGRRKEVRYLTAIMVVFLFLQAGLGAWAVMYPQLSAVLALHFGVSIIAFTSVLLTAAIVFEADGGDAVRSLRVPGSFALYAWGVAVYSYLVIYLGAYVRHTNATKACPGWPMCNGKVALVDLSSKAAVAFAHRAAAGLLFMAILGLVLWARRMRSQRPDLYRASVIALALVAVQSLAGAAVVWTNVDLFAALTHAGLVALMFGALAYTCLHVLPRSEVPARAGLSTGRAAIPKPASAPH